MSERPGFDLARSIQSMLGKLTDDEKDAFNVLIIQAREAGRASRVPPDSEADENGEAIMDARRDIEQATGITAAFFDDVIATLLARLKCAEEAGRASRVPPDSEAVKGDDHAQCRNTIDYLVARAAEGVRLLECLGWGDGNDTQPTAWPKHDAVMAFLAGEEVKERTAPDWRAEVMAWREVDRARNTDPMVVGDLVREARRLRAANEAIESEESEESAAGDKAIPEGTARSGGSPDHQVAPCNAPAALAGAQRTPEGSEAPRA